MTFARRYSLFVAAIFGSFCLGVQAQNCPGRPQLGTVVYDPYDLASANGVLDADFVLGHSVDEGGYTHYCYNYKSPKGIVEAPTIRVNQGDTLKLGIKDDIKSDDSAGAMKMDAPSGPVCGESGPATVSSTNVHFHGMNVPPICHQDDVLNTLIQPGSPVFQYNMQIPADQPPGLYWYHPHVHGFTEFQVNGGAAGALVVNGMESVRPEVAGLTERVFVIRQQYLVPWIPGPYQLTINFHQAVFGLPLPKIEMKPGEKQFWRIANATLQDFLVLQVQYNLKAQQFELIALDGYPLAQPRMENTIIIPPAGRAEFIVQAPTAGESASFVTENYSTGPTGNPDLLQTIATIELASDADKTSSFTEPVAHQPVNTSRLIDETKRPATTQRKLYFSEEFGGTNGPIQFYITVDGQAQKVFEPNEKPAIVTQVGAQEDWTIENRALETHAFHIHQQHFTVLEVDGKPVTNHDMMDTIAIPFWEGPGHPYHSVKLRMDFSDPNTAGTYVFHCHILLHEDLGMMHKILVKPAGAS
jgi:FtsP/CotA-like multicopper oxidase with cupredoxin domain